MNLTYILLICYLCTLMFIAFKDNKTEDTNGFIIADRKVGILGFISSSAASFRDGGGIITAIGMGFIGGYCMYNFYIGCCLGFLFLAFFAPYARTVAEKKGYLTITEMIRDVIGPKTEKISSIITIIVYGLMLSVEFYVLGNLVHTLFGVSNLYSTWLVCLIVTAYVALGGYKTVIKTDILQFFIMLIPIILLFFTPLKLQNVLDVQSLYHGQDVGGFVLMLIMGFLCVVSLGDFWQRIFSSKSAATAKKSLLCTIFSFFLITVPMTFLGMSAMGLLPSSTTSDNALFEMLKNPVYPQFFGAFLTLIIVSVVMSSIDTFAYLTSSTIIKDFNLESKNNAHYMKMSRLITTAVLVIATLLSFYIEHVIAYIFAITGMITIIAPVFCLVGGGFIKKKNVALDIAISLSLLVTLCIGIYLMFTGFLFSSLSASLILPAISSVLVIVFLLYARYKTR